MSKPTLNVRVFAAVTAAFLLLAIAPYAGAQTSSGGPVDLGGGDYAYWSATFAPPFTYVAITYFGPDFPTPIVVTITEDGQGYKTFFVAQMIDENDSFMPQTGWSTPIGP